MKRRFHMKKRSKQLCTLLVAVFALCFAHGTACADEANNDTFHELIDYDALFSTEGQQHIVEEMKEFRGEDEKHLRRKKNRGAYRTPPLGRRQRKRLKLIALKNRRC